MHGLKPLLKPPMAEHLTPVRLREMEKLNEAIHRLRAVKKLRKSPQPVAVALDPHRLLEDWREQDRILQEIAALCDSDEQVREPTDVLQAVRDTLARLRGVAAVRVEGE